MPDPRTDLYNVLSRRLTEEMVARDEAWADYWQRRRVVVVPDDGVEDKQQVFHRPMMIAAMTEAVMTTDAIAARQNGDVIRDCIARLKAAREKDSTNRNLSTLLAVVVKVQRDLEALLNGSGK